MIDKGAIAEMAFATHAARKGWVPFLPVGHAQLIDLVISKPGARPLSVQVKTALKRESGNYRIVMTSRRRGTKRRPHEDGTTFRTYQPGDFDILAGYVVDQNAFFIAWLNDVSGMTSLAFSPNDSRIGDWERIEI